MGIKYNDPDKYQDEEDLDDDALNDIIMESRIASLLPDEDEPKPKPKATKPKKPKAP